MSINREERRALKKKVANVAKRVAALEKIAQDPERREEAIAEIDQCFSSLSILEMMAVEDYIMSKGLLKDNFSVDSNNK